MKKVIFNQVQLKKGYVHQAPTPGTCVIYMLKIVEPLALQYNN